MVIDTSELGAAEAARCCAYGARDGDVALRVDRGAGGAAQGTLAAAVPGPIRGRRRDTAHLNGKKCEVPVKKIIAGVDPEKAVSREALQNPDALDPFLALGRGGS